MERFLLWVQFEFRQYRIALVVAVLATLATQTLENRSEAVPTESAAPTYLSGSQEIELLRHEILQQRRILEQMR